MPRSWKFLSGLLTVAASASAEGRAQQPIVLETQAVGSAVELKVVGRAPHEVAASYALEVQSGATSSNRSVQRGQARLRPGIPVTLINLRLGNAAREGWRAVLRVKPESGAEYVIEARAEEPR